MARTLKRAAAFGGLGRALMSGSRGGPPIAKRVAAVPRMLAATARGQYDGGLRVAMMTAAVLYVASPVDFVPEAVFAIFGLADDALMITWLAGSVLSETERYLEWEEEKRKVVVP